MRATIEVKCPKCGSDDCEPRMVKGDYQREYTKTNCRECDYALTFEDYGKALVRQVAKPEPDAC